MKCSNCSHIISDGEKFCTRCGQKVECKSESNQGNVRVPKEKNAGLAFLLSILLSGLGHFYLGLHKRGLTFLIAFLVSLRTYQFYISVIIWTICLIDIFGCAKRFTKGEHIKDSIF
jgi:hypothetical protein